MDKAIIRDYIKQNADRMHRDILGLISIPSVSTDRQGARRALNQFLQQARSFGLETSLSADGDVGLAEYGAGLPLDAETLGILGHVDVVDPGDLTSWSRAPWGEITDCAVWGRGTQDDKGPLVLCLHALRAVIATGLQFRRRVRFIIGTMEEIDWSDIRAWSAEPGSRFPDFGFTPDGEFPVINREKGYCDAWLDFRKPGPAGLRSYPVGDFSLEQLEAGSSINSVPETAFAVLSGHNVAKVIVDLIGKADPELASHLSVRIKGSDRVEVGAKGVAAHSSLPELGRNALVLLCKALAPLNAGSGRPGLVDFIAEHFGSGHQAESLGLQTRDEAAEGESMGPTIVSPDIARTQDQGFSIGINMRTAWGQTRDEIFKVYHDASRKYGYSFSLDQFMPAILVPRDRPFMQALMRAYELNTGLAGEFILAPGSSYAKAMPNHVSFGPILPGMADLCHQADEHLKFEDIQTCTAIWATAIAEIVGGTR